MGGFISVLYLAIVVLYIIGMYKAFEKAGRPGWAAIIPVYNAYVACEIARLPILWFILALLPCVNFVAWIVICLNIAQHFGKTAGYGVGMALLGFVFWPMLGFSDAQYTGTAGIAQEGQPIVPSPTQPPAQQPPQQSQDDQQQPPQQQG